MKHIIDYSMLYDADNGILRLLEEEESFIQLSNQTSRLLYVLLNNREKVLTRDYLVKSVWEDYGFSGSTISVNVALSELRKAFKSLGHDPSLVQTIRRKGLCFTANVEPVITQPEEEDRPVTQEVKKEKKPKTFTIKAWMLLSAIALLNVIFIIMFYLILNRYTMSFNPGIENTEIRNIGNYKSCTVFLVGYFDFESTTSLRAQAEKEINRWNINCDNDDSDIFYATFNKMQLRSAFISICKRDTSGQYNSCLTHRLIAGK